MRRMGTILSDVRRMLPNHHISEESVPPLHTCEESVPIHHLLPASTNYGFRVNEWNQMHFRKGWEEGSFGIKVRNTHDCYMKLHYSHERKKGMQPVTYCYQFVTHCEVLESVLHGVKQSPRQVTMKQ